jgi:hypothetical protein
MIMHCHLLMSIGRLLDFCLFSHLFSSLCLSLDNRFLPFVVLNNPVMWVVLCDVWCRILENWIDREVIVKVRMTSEGVVNSVQTWQAAERVKFRETIESHVYLGYKKEWNGFWSGGIKKWLVGNRVLEVVQVSVYAWEDGWVSLE